MIASIQVQKITGPCWWCGVYKDGSNSQAQQLNDGEISTTVLTDIEGNILQTVLTADTEEELQQLLVAGLPTPSGLIKGDLSPHPTDKSIIRRYVSDGITQFSLIDGAEKISVKVFVEHFKAGKPLKQLNGYVIINATNADKMPDGTGVFDYLYDFSKVAGFEEAAKTGVYLADVDGSINRKLYS